MAQVIITFKIMPEDLEVNLDELEKDVKEFLEKIVLPLNNTSILLLHYNNI